MLAAIAWRNIWRNKLRSAVIMAAIAIGIVGGIVSDGIMTGMADQRVNAAISNEISNIQINNPQFLLNKDLKYILPTNLHITKIVKAYDEVKGVSSRLQCEAMASSASAGAGISSYGVIPSDEKKVSNIHNLIIKGSYLNDKQKIPAVIGKKLATKLHLGIDDRIIVTLADTSGTITSGAFQIVGIFKTGNDIFDMANIFVRKKDLARIIGLSPKVSHQIAIRLKNNNTTERVIAKIKNNFSQPIKDKLIIVKSWFDIAPMLRSMVEMMNMFSFIFMLVILVALAFAIINTMVMAIMERTREIGMLMALGLNKKKIFILIMLETVFLSLVGAIIGLTISILIIHHYATSGFDLTALGGGLNSIGYSAVIYFRVNTQFYFVTLIMVVFIAIIAAISPARKALKLQPATAIHDSNI